MDAIARRIQGGIDMVFATVIIVLMVLMLVVLLFVLGMLIAPDLIGAWIAIKEKIRKLEEMEGKE